MKWKFGKTRKNRWHIHFVGSRQRGLCQCSPKRSMCITTQLPRECLWRFRVTDVHDIRQGQQNRRKRDSRVKRVQQTARLQPEGQINVMLGQQFNMCGIRRIEFAKNMGARQRQRLPRLWFGSPIGDVQHVRLQAARTLRGQINADLRR